MSLNVTKAPSQEGKLFGSTSTENITLGKALLTHVVDIKANNSDLIVLTKAGKVIVFVNGKQRKEMEFPAKVVKISAGCEHVVVLLATGQAYVWGSFENPGFMFREPYVPVKVLKDETIVDIVSGRDHFVALSSDGQVFTMGCGAQGQLGRIGERSALDGGRRGVKVLLAPGRVHLQGRQKADKIWATRRGTFYRDWKSGAIYGCGDNVGQRVAPVKKTDMKMEYIFKPVLTSFKDIDSMGDQVALMEDGEMITCGLSEGQWTGVNFEGVKSVFDGPTITHFIDEDGDVFQWATDDVKAVYEAKVNNSARAFNVCRTDDLTFLLIA